ncbi:[LysW]-aminoadipate kinase [Sphaerisporangium sp. NPDC051017]|uniref:[LysW]-aminoadipate kinase n=1 Tax=Sphaerisporangium sp. NPDC051017 TaxID=3154636 RepID=UPI003420CF7B
MTDITVVKCGGNAAVEADEVCADVAALRERGAELILVHGGSADIERLAARLGVPSRQVVAPDGVPARYTDPAMLEVVTLALAGMAKPRLLTSLAALGVPAVGLTGLDAGLLRARRKAAHRAVVDGVRVMVRDNQVGTITSVNAGLLRTLLAAGLVPVISPPALAEDGRPVNVNADRVAAAVAAAVGAARLVMLTGAPGVLADVADPDSVLPVVELSPHDPPAHRAGGMGLKLIAAREALTAGVPETLIADGRRPRPVTAALDGAATTVVLAGRDRIDTMETSP